MKKPHSRIPSSGSSGFTLIELLVVMAIIAILVGVLTAATGAAIRMAMRAKAANMATQIQTASIGYYTEYGLYPVPTSPAPVAGQDYLIADTTAVVPAWKALLYGLCGNINSYDASTASPTGAVANTRAIAFLNLKSTDVDSFGGPLNPLPTGTGATAQKYFNIVLDNDYDNIVGDTGTTGKVPNFSTSTTGSILYYAAGAGPTGGVVVWANCNGSSTASTQNPNYYVKTY